MKYLDTFYNINSKIKKVTHHKKVKHRCVEIFFQNGKKIKFIPEGDCCSISCIINFRGFPFSKLIGKKIKSLKEIENEQLIDISFKNINPINHFNNDDENDDDFYRFHLYEITFTDNVLFKFGLINASNGYYDGWISISDE